MFTFFFLFVDRFKSLWDAKNNNNNHHLKAFVIDVKKLRDAQLCCTNKKEKVNQ